MNPYEMAYHFAQKYKDMDGDSNYDRVIVFAVENGFSNHDVRNAISDMKSLTASAEDVLKRIISLCSYPGGHIRRAY